MFDYYGMPLDWPGRREASVKEPKERARYVQDMVHAEIAGAMGGRFDPKYFIPYVQLHEFEALAFADVDVLVSVLAPLTTLPAETLIERLTAVLDEAKSPETINDGYETCPSRRISGIVPRIRSVPSARLSRVESASKRCGPSVPTSAFGWRVWNILVTGKLEPRRDAGPPAPARPRFSPKRSRFKFDENFVLLRWMLWLFDKKSFEQLAEPFKSAELEGLNEDNNHRLLAVFRSLWEMGRR